jgi:diguanylate cyclase (GGDEF)-like protein/PAS domain S-box-containing protein
VKIGYLAQKWPRPRLALFVGAILLSAAILGTNAITLGGLRENTLRSVEANLTSQGIVLAEETDRSFKVLDLTLSMVSNHVASLGINDSNALQSKLANHQTHQWLKEKSGGMAHVDAITLIGAQGKLINFSRYWPIPNVDVSDRDYFQALKADATLETFISKPVHNRGTGTATIYLARRLNAPDGDFMGLVLGAVALQYFEGFFKSISLQDGSAVALFRQDGMLLARHPRSSEVGKIIPTVAAGARAKTARLLRNESPLDGRPRLVSARPLPSYPLLIAVSQTEESALLGWRSLASLSNMMATGSAFLILLTALAVSRWWRRQESLTEEFREQNLRFDAAMQHMAQGLAMFDRDRKLIVCNDRYAEMYGLPSDLTTPGTPQRKILEHRVKSGAYSGPSADQYIAERTAFPLNGTPSDTTIELKTGRIIAIAHRLIAGGGWVATHDDITERRRAEMERDRNRVLLDMVVENVPSTIVVKDAHDFRYLLVNRAGEQYYGMSRDQMIGRTAYDCLATSSADLVTKLDRQVVETYPEPVINEHAIEMPGGKRIGMSTRRCFLSASGQPEYVLAVVDDTTERRAAEAHIAHMARHDALTDLPNRVLLRERLELGLTAVERGDRCLAVLMLDLDRFKETNDTLGHPVGDALLKAVAGRLGSCVRDTATIARLGGDEFAIVEDVTDPLVEASALAERIQKELSAPFDLGDHQVLVGASIGIAIAPNDGINPDQLLKNTDLALYRAKSDGRGTYRFFEPAMDRLMQARRKLERDLRNALANEEFELHYQPFLNLQSDQISGCEALLRWRHPERGMVSPADFIPLAEETGLIAPIGEWVIRTACGEAATWPGSLRIAVNLSPAQLRSPQLLSVVTSALASSGIAPARLELEVTESVMMQDGEVAFAVLGHLHALGVRIALDDFGTGYSSLSFLRGFAFDNIKIDRSFVTELSQTGDGSGAIARALIRLATSLGKTTTAEGVETKELFELVRAEGCTEMQGFYLSRPKPASAIAELLGMQIEKQASAA